MRPDETRFLGRSRPYGLGLAALVLYPAAGSLSRPSFFRMAGGDFNRGRAAIHVHRCLLDDLRQPTPVIS